jgi:hypothetical protein
VSATLRAAVLERLNGANVKAFDSPPPDAIAYPYVVVYFDSGIRSSDRVADVRVHRAHSWQTTTVGVNAGQVAAALDRVTGALEDWTPDVDGLTCSKVDHDGSQPTRPDPELADRTLFIATDQWRAESEPA